METGLSENVQSNTNRWSQDLWNEQYAKLVNYIEAPPTDPTRQFLEKMVQVPQNGTCFEIGCYPGHYLPLFGRKGFILNGLDLAPGVDTSLKAWLEKDGYKTGYFGRDDFLQKIPSEKFDLVYSLGFLEHFTDWPVVLKRHTELVKKGGRIIITAPNFAGIFQRITRYLLDRENLNRHYLPSMRPELWAAELKRLGFEVEFYGYFGGYHFWIDDQYRTILQRIGVRLLREAAPYLRKILPQNWRPTSGFCGVIARLPA